MTLAFIAREKHELDIIPRQDLVENIPQTSLGFVVMVLCTGGGRPKQNSPFHCTKVKVRGDSAIWAEVLEIEFLLETRKVPYFRAFDSGFRAPFPVDGRG